MHTDCRRCTELYDATDEVLTKIREITSRQLEALRANDFKQLMLLDKQLELTVGEKERLFGANREHEQSHR